MKEFLHHLFLPRESNNHRAKILHHKSILFIIAILVIGHFSFLSISKNFSDILGVATNISSRDLFLLTNQKRQEKKLPLLVLNDTLSQAAGLKAKDMFEKNYWAHNSPGGTTPWVFIQKSGYEYIYAGENLARGFNSPEDVINAWMESPSHKENMLSQNYKDVGFAIMKGKLLGEETILVVEMLGNSTSAIAAKEISANNDAIQTNPSVYSYATENVKPKPLETLISSSPLFDINGISFNISMSLIFLFILVLILDMIVVERKKIIRLVGHNLDHVFFLSSMLILLILFSRGIVL